MDFKTLVQNYKEKYEFNEKNRRRTKGMSSVKVERTSGPVPGNGGQVAEGGD